MEEEIETPVAPETDTQQEPPAAPVPETQDTPAPAPEAEPRNDTTTPINPWDAFNDTLTGEPDSADTADDLVPSDAPLGPHADTQTPEADTDEQKPGETDSDHVARILARYKTPEEMAKAMLHLRRKVTEQGQRLSQKPSATPVPEPVPLPETPREGDVPAVPPVAQAQAVAQTPEPDNRPVMLPGDGIRPEDIYNPETWKHNEETGWPVDENGEEVWPVDEFGIAFTPQSAWDKRLEVLEEETGSAARALDAVNRERQADLLRYQREYQDKFKIVANYQMQNLRSLEPELATAYKNYEEPVAKAFAFEIGKAAWERYHALVSANQLTRQQMKDPNTVKQIAEEIQFGIYKSGKTDEYAQVLRQNLPDAVKPEPFGSTPKGTAPPAGGGGSAPVPVTETVPKVTARVKSVADKTGIDPKEVESFSRKDFTFELN